MPVAKGFEGCVEALAEFPPNKLFAGVCWAAAAKGLPDAGAAPEENPPKDDVAALFPKTDPPVLDWAMAGVELKAGLPNRPAAGVVVCACAAVWPKGLVVATAPAGLPNSD